ncbi:MAG: DUF805 domain-containing protein [Actinomycetota bacterium]
MGIVTGEGRVNRLQYFAINLALGVGWVVAVLLATPGPGEPVNGDAIALLVVLLPVVVWMSVVNMVRRLHDRGLSGRWAWWSIVPFAAFFLGLYLLFAPGDETANAYGPPPGPVDPKVLEARRAELDQLQHQVKAVQAKADETYLRADGTFDTDWLTSSVPGLGPSTPAVDHDPGRPPH